MNTVRGTQRGSLHVGAWIAVFGLAAAACASNEIYVLNVDGSIALVIGGAGRRAGAGVVALGPS